MGRIFNIASWSMVAVVSAWSLSFFLATICECNPRELLEISSSHYQIIVRNFAYSIISIYGMELKSEGFIHELYQVYFTSGTLSDLTDQLTEQFKCY